MKKKHRLGASLTAAAMLCLGLSPVLSIPAAAEAAPADAAPREISAADRAQVTTSPYYPEYDPFANVETDQYGNEYPPGTNALCEVRLEIKEYPQQVFAVGEEFNTNGLKVFMIAQYTHNQKDYDVTPVLNIRTDYDADTPGTYTVWLSSDYVDGEVYAEDEISYEVTVDSTVTTAPYEGDDIVTGGIETTCTTAAAAPRIAAGEGTVRVGERGHIYYPIDTSSIGSLLSISQEPRGIVQNLDYSSYSGSMRLDFTGKAVGTTKVTLFMSDGSGYEFIITVLPEDTPVETTETTETWDTTTTTTTSTTAYPEGEWRTPPVWVGIGESEKVAIVPYDGVHGVISVREYEPAILSNIGFEYSVPDGLDDDWIQVYFTGAEAGQTEILVKLEDGTNYTIPVTIGAVTSESEVWAYVGGEVTCPVQVRQGVTVETYAFSDNSAAVEVTNIEDYGTMFNFHIEANDLGTATLTITLSDSSVVVLHITAAECFTTWTTTQLTSTSYNYTGSYHTGTHPSVSSSTRAGTTTTTDFDDWYLDGPGGTTTEPGTKLYEGETDRLRFTCVYDEESGTCNTDVRPELKVFWGNVTVRDAGTEYDEDGNAYILVEVTAPSAPLQYDAYIGIYIGEERYFVKYLLLEGERPAETAATTTATEWRREYSFYTPWDSESDVSLLLEPADEIETYELTGVPVELRNMKKEGDRLTLTFYGETPGEAQFIAHTHMGMTLVINITIGDGFTHVFEETDVTETTTADGFGTGTYPTAVTALHVGETVTQVFTLPTDAVVEYDADSPTVPRVFSEFGLANVSVSNVLTNEFGPYFVITIEGAKLGTDRIEIDSADYPDLYLLVLPETVEDDPLNYPSPDICTGKRLTAVAEPVYAADSLHWNAAFLNKLLGTELIEDVEVKSLDAVGCRELILTLKSEDPQVMSAIAEQLYEMGVFGALGVTDAEPYLPVITTTTTELEPDCVTTETTTTASSAVSSTGEGGSELPQTGNNDPTALVLGLLAGLLTLGGAAVLVRRKEEA